MRGGGGSTHLFSIAQGGRVEFVESFEIYRHEILSERTTKMTARGWEWSCITFNILRFISSALFELIYVHFNHVNSEIDILSIHISLAVMTGDKGFLFPT